MKIALVVLFDIFLQCFSFEPDTRIIGGGDADIYDFPYQAGLSINSSTWCGGSLISKTCILTAAHCVNDDPANTVRVYLGSSKRARGTLRIARSKTVHPRYKKGTWFNDIACLKIDPIDFSRTIRPALMASGSDSYEGRPATASGWGKSSDDGTVVNDLQAAELRVISNAECANTFANIVPGKLCTRPKPGTDTSICQGDSGGPLVLRNTRTLVGVASFTSAKSCQQGLPSGFARVSSYNKWVKDNCGCGV